MEKVVTARLVWYFEHNNLFNPSQSGFRQGRSTADHISRIYTDANIQLHNQGITKAIFIDLEKAFDMIWHDGLKQKLLKYGLNGHILNWISKFLANRTFQVNIESALSDTFHLENGTPQGSVISPILFDIMINDIPFTNKIESSLYADDCAIWASGRNESFINKYLQENVDILQKWCDTWGFQISHSKTQGINFTLKAKLLNTKLKLRKDNITFTDNIKFLGVTFDRRLTFKAHIKNVADRCNKLFNILKCLSGTSWGGGKDLLLLVYRGLIRSVMDYASFIYLNVSASNIQILHVELGELSVCLRHKLLNIVYAIKVINSNNHPSYKIFKNPVYTKYTTKLLTSIHQEYIDDINLPVSGFYIPPQPPWQVPRVNIDTSLTT